VISFEGQVAVVTGAARGLGRAYALEFARRGAQVVVNDLGVNPFGTIPESTPADTVVAEIKAAGGDAVANYDSVATPEGGEAIIGSALDAFGRVDVVVHNAAILRDKTFANITPEDFEAVLDVHLRGGWYVTQPAFRSMKGQNYGRLIYITSAAGLFGNFGQSNYGAAKMGLVGIANTAAIEGARYGITANVVAPLAKTRLTTKVGDEAAPEHVAALVAYLASRDCDLTHEVFAAGCGWYARAFVGLTEGWKATEGMATAEDVAAAIDKIRNEAGYSVPLDATAAAGAILSVLTGAS